MRGGPPSKRRMRRAPWRARNTSSCWRRTHATRARKAETAVTTPLRSRRVVRYAPVTCSTGSFRLDAFGCLPAGTGSALFAPRRQAHLPPAPARGRTRTTRGPISRSASTRQRISTPAFLMIRVAVRRSTPNSAASAFADSPASYRPTTSDRANRSISSVSGGAMGRVDGTPDRVPDQRGCVVDASRCRGWSNDPQGPLCCELNNMAWGPDRG
jgi:hypothetical protein